MGPLEDAALVRPEATAELAFTVDFITPVVDGPEEFGAIAAANALSDVYAMGGDPQVALVVCGFPQDLVSRDVLQRIFRGGRDKAAEAGCAIVGGHTILDPELKYGLCVLGRVDPAQRLTHTHARAGDALVLTKPLGLGVASQGLKQGRLATDEVATVVSVMSTLNRAAKDAAVAAGARAATDVTGYGLLGHLRHLLLGSGVAARVYAGAVPFLPFAHGLARAGVVPGGSKGNLAYVAPHVTWDARVEDTDRLLLADAQTSGGLVVAVSRHRLGRLLSGLEERGTLSRAVIGEVIPGPAGHIVVSAGEAPRPA